MSKTNFNFPLAQISVCALTTANLQNQSNPQSARQAVITPLFVVAQHAAPQLAEVYE